MIDDEEMEVKINTLRALEGTITAELRKVEGTRHALEAIRLQNGGNPTDAGLGTQMTDARRQEIYDSCTAVADSLIAQFPEYPPERTTPPGP